VAWTAEISAGTGCAAGLSGTVIFLLLALMLLQVRAQVLRVAVPTENYPPFYYQKNGTVSGFSIEVLQAVAAEMALTLEWHHLPWNRMM